MDLKEAITSRKSTKRFDGKPVSWKKIIQAIDVAKNVPLAGNMNVAHLIIVENRDSIEKIAGATQQKFVADAGALIVVVSGRERLKKMFDANDKGFAAQQAGAMIQNLLLALTEKKIDSCWVGFFDDDIIKDLLKIPEGEVIEAVIALGTAAKIRQEARKKPDLENLVFFEKFGTRKKEPEIMIPHDWS